MTTNDFSPTSITSPGGEGTVVAGLAAPTPVLPLAAVGVADDLGSDADRPAFGRDHAVPERV